MSLTSYRTAPPRVRVFLALFLAAFWRAGWAWFRRNCLVGLDFGSGFGRPGGALLFRGLSRSTIGAEGFHGRVRDGIGWGTLAMATRPAKTGGLSGRRRVCNSGRPTGWLLGEEFACVFGGFWYRARLVWVRSGVGLCDGLCAGHGGAQAERAISTGRLHALPHVHFRPINVVVYHGSSGIPGFQGGFPLRCFQRLSFPYLATRLCRWRDNRSTRGTSTPVLSYWEQLLASIQHPRQIGTELSRDVLNPAHVPL